MKRSLAVLFIILFVICAAFAEDRAITIINDTEYPIMEIYASLSASDDWGDNLLPDGDIIEWGDETTISLDISTDYYYDFKLVDTDGDYYKKWDIDISNISEITFTFDDFESGDSYYDDSYDDYDYYSDYDSGWDDGYSSGYQEGYRDAFSEAYKMGFADGLETARDMIEY